MHRFVVFAAGVAFAAVPAFSQGAAQTPAAAAQAAPPHVATARPAAPASTPESRSAAALALSHEPTFDEGTAQRIKDAALSYSDLAVRGAVRAYRPPDLMLFAQSLFGSAILIW